MNLAEFRILLILSDVCVSDVGPNDMSRQYSTVAAHNLRMSAP